MQTARLFHVMLCTLLLVQLTAVEERKSEAEALSGIFGEFTLVGGEKVIGLYHPEKGSLEVYSSTKVREVKAKDIVVRRRWSPESESEPKNLDEGQARANTLGMLISNAQTDMRRLEIKQAQLEKARQSRELERSKREEGNKDAAEAMASEKDPGRKAVFAALSTEHLQAIAATHVAIADIDMSLGVVEMRMNAATAYLEDLQTRRDWLSGRLTKMNREASAK